MTLGRVGVVVLGDLGRSPRMKYHVLSLLSHGFEVHLIGYGGSPLPESILKNEKLKVVHMKPVPLFITKLPKLLSYIMKTLCQVSFILVR